MNPHKYLASLFSQLPKLPNNYKQQLKELIITERITTDEVLLKILRQRAGITGNSSHMRSEIYAVHAIWADILMWLRKNSAVQP